MTGVFGENRDSDQGHKGDEQRDPNTMLKEKKGLIHKIGKRGLKIVS